MANSQPTATTDCEDIYVNVYSRVCVYVFIQACIGRRMILVDLISVTNM